MWAAAGWRKSAESLVAALCLALAPGAIFAADGTTGAAPKQVLVMGDSLSAAYGLAAEQGWVHLLNERLEKLAPGWNVVNASISGETTAGGAARIDAALKQHSPELVVIELGANDALRGLPIEHASANLERMIVASEKAGAQVMLIGIRIPPNYGPEYAQALETMYVDLAKKYSTPLLPFLLEPIARDRSNFLPDNLHPTAQAQPKLLDHVWSVLQKSVQTTSR